ncbi:acyltransferase family protein [Sinomonas sp. P47F7]|uniref:acyltransferase family protein n=1 Tax=Sinomonas sp. P47F7 TaxID=3410987 RepID=UPI003BF5D974
MTQRLIPEIVNGTPAGPRTRRDIQGLRAIAVCAVLVYHANPLWLPGGYVGVDVFFVISGFLITLQLLRRQERTNSQSLRDFYARRIRRLLPVAVFVLLASLVAAKLLLPPLMLIDVGDDARATALYLSNMWFAFNGTDYLANQSPSLFQHYWSLAVEEQFYLLWPLLLLLLKGKNRLTLATVVVLTVASFIGCSLLTFGHKPYAFFSLPSRAWEFGVGAMVAMLVPKLTTVPKILALFLGWIGLGGIAASLFLFSDLTAFPGWVASIPVAATALVVATGVSPHGRSGVEVLLGLKPLQVLGNISYSLYLWHWPVFLIAGFITNHSADPAVAIALIAGSLILALLSFTFIEQPFRDMSFLKERTYRSYGFSAVATVVALAASFVFGTPGRLDTGRPAESISEFSARDELPISSFVPSNMKPSLMEARNSVAAVFNDGCHVAVAPVSSPTCSYGAPNSSQTIVLFGDSHAAQWFTPLAASAEASGRHLISLTKSACPSVSMTTTNENLGAEYFQCDAWRINAIERIRRIRPQVVVVANWANHYRQSGVYEGDFVKAWESGLQKLSDELPSGTKMIIIGDNPTWTTAPNLCLSAHLEDVGVCSLLPHTIERDIYAVERTAARQKGGVFLPVADWLCPNRCGLVFGNVLAYRDDHHITNSLAQALQPRLDEALAQTLGTK